MQNKKYNKFKRLAEDRDTWRKMTHQLAETEHSTHILNG